MNLRHRRTRRLFLEPLESRTLLDASGDFFEVHQNSGTQILDVLQNDRFAAGYTGPARITSTTFGSKGGLIRIAEDGKSVEYDPPADGSGTESFLYYVDFDFHALVTISIVAPLQHDHFTVNPNDRAWTLDVMANDPFWNGYQDARRITSVSQTRLGGDIEISADGKSLVYTPPSYEVGKDAFMYFVDDLYPAEVIIDIADPLAADKKLDIVWNTENNKLDVLANDPFWKGYAGERRITHLVVGDFATGSFSIASDGLSVNYTPAQDYQGFETIRYVVDGRHEQTITVQVHRPVQDDSYWFRTGTEQPRLPYWDVPPVAADDPDARLPFDVVEHIAGGSEKPSRAWALPLIENDVFSWRDDRYAYGDSRAWVTVDVVDRITSVGTSKAGATIEISRNGQGVYYTPPEGFLGFDTFEYIADGKYTATVTITIEAPPPPPPPPPPPSGGGSPPQPPPNVCSTLYDSLVANQNSSSNVVNVLANDFKQQGHLCDPYYGARRITEVTEPQSGTVTISADRKSVSYTPDADFVGGDYFLYTVDGLWTETVSVNVVRRVREDQFRVEPDSTGQLEVLRNDLFGADYRGPQRITAVTASQAGASVSVSDTRDSITYTPPTGYTGEDRFTYIVDGGLKAEVRVFVGSSRDEFLRRFDSESLFEPLLEEALSRWNDVFGTTVEHYPWARNGLLSTAALDVGIAGNSSSELRIHSETNVQVQGIDEADIVETDSDFLYVVRDGELIIARAWPANRLSVVSRTRIDGQPIGEYLNGTRLTVVSQSYDSEWMDMYAPDQPTKPDGASTSNSLRLASSIIDGVVPYYPTPVPKPTSTVVSVYDVSDRSQPRIIQKTKLDGEYVESRRIGDQIFVVQRNQRLEMPEPNQSCVQIEDEPDTGESVPWLYIYSRESCTYETREDYVARVTQLFDSMLPHYASYNAEGDLVRTGLAIAPEDIYRPQDENARSLISVVAINMSIDEPGLSGASGILTTGADTVYGGWDGLYVLERGNNYEDGDVTRILKFDWNADTGMVDFAAFGQVAGYLLNQFSVDTHDGYLRIATTLWNRGGGNYSTNAENTIFVLRDDEGVMEVVGDLQNLGFTEHIKSVRFMGERAFVTTFNEIDPFFVIDMSDPAAPRPVGHVTLPGFSSYMQMIDENHVLTIGRNAVTETTGSTQVILFDVTNVTRPRIVGRHSFYRDSVSIAETDHHAFGWFAPHNVLAIPLAETHRTRVDADNDGYPETWEYHREDDLAVLEIDVNASVETRDGVRLRGEVANDSQVLRGAFIDNVLYSIAHDSITAVDINDPASIIDQVRIAPAEPVPATTGETADSAARARQLLGKAREEIVRHLGRPVAPMLVTVETPRSSLRNLESNLLFSVGDQVLRVTSDAAGNVAVADERFAFSERNARHWRNEPRPTDVNDDTHTSPLDALILINEMERTGPKKLATQSVVRQIETLARRLVPFYDVSGDGWLSPIDVLHIVNWLELANAAEGEHAFAVDAVFGSVESWSESPAPSSRNIGLPPLVLRSQEPIRQASSKPADAARRMEEDAKKWSPLEDLASDILI